jgi:hypothetical protein
MATATCQDFFPFLKKGGMRHIINVLEKFLQSIKGTFNRKNEKLF